MYRVALILLIALVSFIACKTAGNKTPSAMTDTSKGRSVSVTDTISFVTKVDTANATKDGIYMNEYVVNMDYSEIKRLHGKTVRVSGKVTIVKGVQNSSGGLIQQGREGDSKHILSPKIEVISN